MDNVKVIVLPHRKLLINQSLEPTFKSNWIFNLIMNAIICVGASRLLQNEESRLKYLLALAELDTRVSVLSDRELDTNKTLDSSDLRPSFIETVIFPALELPSE